MLFFSTSINVFNHPIFIPNPLRHIRPYHRVSSTHHNLDFLLCCHSFLPFREKMNRPGDWNCRSCHHLNFQRRDSCQRCGDSRSGALDYGSFGGGVRANVSSFAFSTGSDVRPGDWYCTAGNCGTHNFASRSSCFKCGAFKDDPVGGGFDSIDLPRARGFAFATGGGGGGGGGRSGWKSGDWICSRLGCNEHNFASRMECFRCSAPRDSMARPY